jgi:FkbM family methyltransferase
MIQRIAHWAGRNLPTSLADIGLRVYTKTYASIFVSGKKEYNLGDFKMILDQSESIMMVSRRFRQYESDVSELISNRIGRGSTYIDIGSNKGYHVLEVATIVGNEGLVYSFEPNPGNFSHLQDNIEINGFQNVRAYKKAVYEQNGTSSFEFGGKSGLGSVSQDGDIEVETITLDRFLNEEKVSPDKIDCIKIDVEGGEASVLAGMTNFLSESDGCTIVIEVHSDADIQRMSQILNENRCSFEKFNEYWIVET